MFVSGQNCSTIIILPRSFFLRGLDWWIPLPPSPDCHIRLTVNEYRCYWLALPVTMATLAHRRTPPPPPPRRLFPPPPFHPSHSSTTSIATTTYTLTYSQAAECCGGGMRESEPNVDRQPRRKWESEMGQKRETGEHGMRDDKRMCVVRRMERARKPEIEERNWNWRIKNILPWLRDEEMDGEKEATSNIWSVWGTGWIRLRWCRDWGAVPASPHHKISVSQGHHKIGKATALNHSGSQ